MSDINYTHGLFSLEEIVSASKLQKLVKELDFGVLLQSLRDDFNEDGGQVPIPIFHKLHDNLSTMIKIQSIVDESQNTEYNPKRQKINEVK